MNGNLTIVISEVRELDRLEVVGLLAREFLRLIFEHVCVMLIIDIRLLFLITVHVHVIESTSIDILLFLKTLKHQVGCLVLVSLRIEDGSSNHPTLFDVILLLIWRHASVIIIVGDLIGYGASKLHLEWSRLLGLS